MKILIDKWWSGKHNVSLVLYRKFMLCTYTNYSNVRKLGQRWWHRGQRFEIIIRLGWIQLTYTNWAWGCK
jgi:hypothetical protein